MKPHNFLADYTQAYRTLYQRNPSEVKDLGGGWVVVNGARMSMRQLEMLTKQLHQEIKKEREAKRSIVKRLLKWFSTPQAKA